MIHQICYCDVKPEKINDVIEHTKKFVELLYPNCIEPKFISANQIGSKELN